MQSAIGKKWKGDRSDHGRRSAGGKGTWWGKERNGDLALSGV